MNTISREPGRVTESSLKQAIEPLASLICATDQRRTVLALAVRLLVNEVEQVNRVAAAHVATVCESGPGCRPVSPDRISRSASDRRASRAAAHGRFCLTME